MHHLPSASSADPRVEFRLDGAVPDHEIALIGCGAVAETHLQAYEAAGFSVGALCDIDEGRARELRDEYVPDATIYTDHSRLLAREEVTVADITTPPDPRPPLVRDALKAGCHVLSQKPFVTDLQTGQSLVKRAAAEDRYLAVNQNARWSPDFGYAKAAAEAGHLGTPHGFHASRWFDYNRIVGDGLAHRLFFHYLIHWIDLARWLLPAGDPVSVTASTARSPTQAPEQPIIANVTIAFEDGVSTLSFDGDSPVVDAHTTGLVGNEGAVVGRGPGLNDRTVTLQQADGAAVPVTIDGAWIAGGFAATMFNLLRAIHVGEEPPHSGRDNLETVALVFAAIESARTGQTIAPGTVQELPDPVT